MQKIDWTLVKEVEYIKKDVRDIKNEVGKLKMGMERLSEKMNQILNLFSQEEKEDESNTNLGKKTRRNKY